MKIVIWIDLLLSTLYLMLNSILYLKDILVFLFYFIIIIIIIIIFV